MPKRCCRSSSLTSRQLWRPTTPCSPSSLTTLTTFSVPSPQRVPFIQHLYLRLTRCSTTPRTLRTGPSLSSATPSRPPPSPLPWSRAHSYA
ncbi:hypothetical protein EXIGLDRAFT_255827 [Exidia glandulosa HHB12029]|uniref:Uncharacterized protein n=1 Tax=Exidia glandulosa HHB12029 TaxID=1314781 RepID=A0A165ZSF5_EXIGL|nr:hypothetical protein EXIGLDRAFT_255827 [Exidia glandulosa HHB12029]